MLVFFAVTRAYYYAKPQSGVSLCVLVNYHHSFVEMLLVYATKNANFSSLGLAVIFL